uniref:Uncharacterized protein n=1 Tax=Lotharella oceanica TaxID=641309 RepID=A0A7S2TP47_9EUKA
MTAYTRASFNSVMCDLAMSETGLAWAAAPRPDVRTRAYVGACYACLAACAFHYAPISTGYRIPADNASQLVALHHGGDVHVVCLSQQSGGQLCLHACVRGVLARYV